MIKATCKDCGGNGRVEKQIDCPVCQADDYECCGGNHCCDQCHQDDCDNYCDRCDDTGWVYEMADCQFCDNGEVEVDLSEMDADEAWSLWCKEHFEGKAKFHITWVSERPDSDSWQRDAAHYRFRLTVGRRWYGGYYSMGSAHTKEPTERDILSALACDISCVRNCRDFEDFCSEFGYDEDSRRAERVYSVCRRTDERLVELLGEDAVEDLTAIQF